MPRTAKHACPIHGEHPVADFYHYAATQTRPERWICKAAESDRQKARSDQRRAAKAGAAPKPTAKKSTAKKSAARKPAAPKKAGS